MTSEEDYIWAEGNAVKDQFDLSEVIEFTSNNDVQVIRGGDYQYLCYINKEAFCPSLTPMHALWFGIQSYKLFKKMCDDE